MMKLKVTFLLLFFLCSATFAQKKGLDEASYAEWKRVDNYTLSPDGRYVIYKYTYIDNVEKNKALERKYYLFDNLTKKTITLDSIAAPHFQANGEWLTFLQGEKSMLMRMKDKKVLEWTKPDSPRFEESGSVVSYCLNKGKDLVYYNLNTNDSLLYQGVSKVNAYDGDKIIYQKMNENSIDICYGKVAKGAKHSTLFSDKTKTLSGYNFNPKTQSGSFQVAEQEGDKNCDLVYNFSLTSGKIELVLNKKDLKIEKPLFLDESSLVRKSDQKYITFHVFPTEPTTTKKYDKAKKESGFELELWSWDDSVSQGIQAISGFRGEKMKHYVYVYNTQTKGYYPLITENYAAFYESNDVNCDYAFFSDEFPYSKREDWEHEQRFDLYLVDLRTAEKKLFKERTVNRASWSPNGDYIIYYDSETGAWMSLEPKTFTRKNISAAIGNPVADEEHDRPNPRPSYGLAAWSKDGNTIFLNDKHDIWAVDITGKTPAYCYTRAYGKKNNFVVRFVNPGYADIIVDTQKSMDLSIVNLANRNGIVATISPDGKIAKNIEGPYAFRVLQRSTNGKTYLYHKQNFSNDRDLWISDSKFKKPYKLTNANPQQENYSWGSVELVEWTTYEGKSNKGLLYLPEGYQKGKSYPSIVNFYETHTAGMNIYHAPSYSSAMLDVATYVSNGYIVFMPDLFFTIGQPGKSCYNTVVSGTNALIERGILDPKRIGLQGHSWSGYQTAYLVTKTDLFACVNIGAPIVNMTAAYNGIREGSGMPRMFMYEDWQCRMGSTMWEALDQYIESSPILYADKIKTPVLLFHCDKDEAVSYSEGRSLFLALRRLQKPAWLLNYMGEGHFLNKQAAKRDWTLRMKQFFDYYLNNTKMPRWMKEGINVNERGYDQKLDY